jgi:hypothetical protein
MYRCLLKFKEDAQSTVDQKKEVNDELYTVNTKVDKLSKILIPKINTLMA